MFMSVIWVNFLGYMFETPAILFLSMKTEKARAAYPQWKKLLASVGIGLFGIAFVGTASGLSLAMNAVTDEWFACVAFLLLWGCVLVLLLRKALARGWQWQRPGQWTCR